MEWISVKDKLPNKYERVLVTDGKQVCLHYKQSLCNFKGSEGEDLYPIGDCKDSDNKWCDCCHIQEGTITYWSYLPSIPDQPERLNPETSNKEDAIV